MTIRYYTKHNYGVPLRYLSKQNGDDINRNLQFLMGAKTITNSAMYALQKLGHVFEEVILEGN